jgi:hypothetical protein
MDFYSNAMFYSNATALEKQAVLFQMAICPLHEAVDFIHGWLLAFTGFLERA